MTTTAEPLKFAKPPVPEHLPGLRDANTIQTPGLREIRVAVTQLFTDGGIILVDGKPGVGKTFATKSVLAELEVPVHWVDMPDTPRGKEANARIFTAVTGHRPPGRMTEFALTEETVDVLDGLKAILAIDEAQNMTASALRQIRYLHDRPSTRALLVLVGPGVGRAVEKVPELDSRVSRRIQMSNLNTSQMMQLLPLLHTTLSMTSPTILASLAETARGNLRQWARVLEVARHLGVKENQGINAQMSNRILRTMRGFPS
jgi:DNA transposition AAA+ family ATPase